MHIKSISPIIVIFLLISSVVLVFAQTDGEAQPDSAAQSNLIESLQETRPDISWTLSMGKIFWSLLIIIMAFFIIKFFTQVFEAYADKKPDLRLGIKRFIPIIRISGWTIVLYTIITAVLAPPIETLVAITASAGIAVGFASQDILKNIFGGIMILFDRPFQTGDKILVGEHYGEVVQIGLRSVRLLTATDSIVSIPNSEIVNHAVSNSNSGLSSCQVVSEFFLPADIDLIETRRIAIRTAATSRFIYLKKPIRIHFKNEVHQGRSLLKMQIKAYVLDVRYEFAFASEMTEICIANLIHHGIVSREDFNLLPSPGING